MRSRARTFIVTGCTVLASLGTTARVSEAQQQGIIGSYYPSQLIPGQTTVLHLATDARTMVQSIEIAPSTGIMVTGMNSRNLNQGSIWWEFTLTVAQDAAPGSRTLVAVLPAGRTAPVALLIPNHVPGISNIRILSAQANQPAVDLQFSAADQGGAFDPSPYVWFLLACGPGQPEAGVVRGKVDNGVLKVSIPNPRTLRGHAGAPAAGNHCDLQVRATDSTGTDSNTATTTFDFK
jgi:hypothetical protein